MATTVLVPLRPYQVYRLERPAKQRGLLNWLRRLWHRRPH